MISYDEALARILDGIVPLAPQEVRLADALGCVLAEDLFAPFDLPPFANSSMDGYAVRAADLPDSSRTLPLQGEVPAGAKFLPTLEAGRTLRILTGAPLPPGADAVVPQEETEAGANGIVFQEPVTAGQCVRPAGEDVRAGSLALAAGRRLRPAEIGMAAALGRTGLRVYPRPRVAIISTGDELAEPGQPLEPGQIYNSNAYGLAAQVAEAGGVVTQQHHARDTPEALRHAFDACAGADLLLTSGGVSVGDHDHVKAVFNERGTMDFWRVAIRPGKPVAFGRWAETVFFGLPGNPVSSMVTFELFARPALRRMRGISPPARPTVPARLTESASHTPGRQSYQRAAVTQSEDGLRVRPTDQQGSGMLRSLTEANALLILPAEIDSLPAGEIVQVLWR